MKRIDVVREDGGGYRITCVLHEILEGLGV